MKNVRSEIVVPLSGGMSARIPTLLGMFFFLFLSIPSSATVIRVPVDYSTIQGAINAVTHGDEIIVSTGTYTENINFLGKNIVLRSTDPLSTSVVAATIINGNLAGSVVTFAGTEVSSCVLSGFTITNGRSQTGGGIRGNGTRATIRYNSIQNNICNTPVWHNEGGGLHNCDGLIEHNSITTNSVHGTWAGGGGLLDCDGLIEHNTISGNYTEGQDENMGGGLAYCDGTVRENVIMGNWARSNEDAIGGGVKNCNGVVEDNTIAYNWVSAGRRWDCIGGGIAGGDGIIQNNWIYGNRAFDFGTGGPTHVVRVVSGAGIAGCRGVIQNNLIYGNAAVSQTWYAYGGGMYDCPGPVRNNTIYGNTASSAGGAISASSTTIRNCILWQNAAPVGPSLDRSSTPSYSCIQNWTSGGTGNISDDPQLADPANGDFHLLSTSPCIDAGGTVPLTVDFEGNPRPFDYTPLPRGDGSDFDIGADEVFVPVMFVITWPTTGTVWQAGTIGNLAFTCQYLPGPSQADVEVWKGGTSVTSLGRVPCQNGLNTVPVRLPATVPAGPGYRIRMFWTVNQAFNSFSNEFTVSPAPTFTITWPTTGTTWQAGILGALIFTCANLPEPGLARLEVWRNDSYLRGLGQVWSQNGLNRVSLRLPADLAPGGNYQLRLYWWETTTVNAFSGKFTVTAAPTFAIIWPTTGTVWQAGTVGNLTFMCANPPPPGEVGVELWKGGAYLRYWTGVPCQYSLNVVPLRLPTDLAPGPNYQIRLYWTRNPAVHAFSGRFTVAPPPTFAISWPTTGTAWQAGTRGNVTFVCANLPSPGQAQMSLHRGGLLVQNMLLAPCHNGINATTATLPVQLATGGNYQIRLVWTDNTAIGAFSGKFTVTPPPTFAITWPTTGTIWQAGSLGAVTWTCRNLPTPGQMYVDIWKGGKYVRYWTSVPVSEGTNSVSLRLPADLQRGADYQIRLSWTENVAICSWSAPFSVMLSGQPLSVTRFYLYY